MSKMTIADMPRISACNKTEIIYAPFFLWWDGGRKDAPTSMRYGIVHPEGERIPEKAD